MEKEIRGIVRRLSSAINESLQGSEEVRELLREAEAKGFKLTLSLAVIVAMNEQTRAPRRPRKAARPAGEADMKPTPFDRKFLKALRLRLIEEQG